MAQKEVKWLKRLIDRITKKDCPNNNHFKYYGRVVNLSSGTRDYVHVHVYRIDECGFYTDEISFSFDYWTKNLKLYRYNSESERDSIIEAFEEIYNHYFESVTTTIVKTK